MDFFRKLTKGKSASQVAKGAAKEMGFDPQIIMKKIFDSVAGGNKDSKGNSLLSMGNLMKLVSASGIMGGNLDKGAVEDSFNKNKGDDGNMNYDQFKNGLRDMAEVKYKDDKDVKDSDAALSKLEDQIITNCKDYDDWTGVE